MKGAPAVCGGARVFCTDSAGSVLCKQGVIGSIPVTSANISTGFEMEKIILQNGPPFRRPQGEDAEH
jgi:hypothetical protein